MLTSLSFWDVVCILGGLDDIVILADDNGVLGEHSELAPSELIEEVAELIAVFVLLGDVVGGELYLALQLLQEHEVDQHVIVWSIQLVFYPHQLELPLELLDTTQILNILACVVILNLGRFYVEYIDDIEGVEQFGLITLELTPKQIANLKGNQIVLVYFYSIIVLICNFACFDEVVDEDAEVLDGERSQHSCHLSSNAPHLGEALNKSATT